MGHNRSLEYINQFSTDRVGFLLLFCHSFCVPPSSSLFARTHTHSNYRLDFHGTMGCVCVDVSVAVIVFYCCWFGVVFACFYVIARARERVGETQYTYLYMYTYLLLQLLRIFHFTNEIQYKQYH